jgi:16S rRNA (guanine966-N2)-methyltransferase
MYTQADAASHRVNRPFRISDRITAMPTLRVIAGAHKGKRLLAPPGLATRPLPDRIKQSLFDWLGQDMSGMSVVDCCAGSGSFACEAISRGAERVWAIEPGHHALPSLRANAKAIGHPNNLEIIAQPFQAALPRMREIDLVFADPPFPWFSEEPETLASLLRLASKVLSRTGRLVIRGEKGSVLPIVNGVREVQRRLYGRSWVAMLEAVAGAPPPIARVNERFATPSMIEPGDFDGEDDEDEDDEEDDEEDEDDQDDDDTGDEDPR